MTLNLNYAEQGVIQLLTDVAFFIGKESKRFDTKHIETKAENPSNLVSYVDKTAEQMLVEGLTMIVPSATFITEEATVAQTHNTDLVWIIDPLDGTTNFVHRLPVYSISVALMQDSQIVLGVVYDVCRQQCFSAIKGEGAKQNGQPMQVSKVKTLTQSLLATGFPYRQFDQIEPYFDLLKDLMKTTQGIRRFGSAALDLAYVAWGCFDAYYEYNIETYDIAAGILLVKESGGKVTDFEGKENYLFGRQVIASNGIIHQELLQKIEQHFNII